MICLKIILSFLEGKGPDTYGIQTNRLKLTISMKKSGVETMHQVPRYFKKRRLLGWHNKPSYFETFWQISQDYFKYKRLLLSCNHTK